MIKNLQEAMEVRDAVMARMMRLQGEDYNNMSVRRVRTVEAIDAVTVALADVEAYQKEEPGEKISEILHELQVTRQHLALFIQNQLIRSPS